MHTCRSGLIIAELVGHLCADESDALLNVALIRITGFYVTFRNSMSTASTIEIDRKS